MRVALIAAMASNRVIGRGNRLPWRLPADLRHFRALTMGKPVIMGRRTFASLGRPLPGRHNIVLSRRHGPALPGASLVHGVDEALAAAGDAAEVMVIGGAELYAQFLPRAERIYLTLVDAEPAGDAWFPELGPGQWREIERADHPADAANPYPYSFRTLVRVGPALAATPTGSDASDSRGEATGGSPHDAR